MKFLIILLTLTVLASAAVWDKKAKIWNIGNVPTERHVSGYTIRAEIAGTCDNVPDKAFACGRTDGLQGGEPGVMRYIYQCQKGQLKAIKTCKRTYKCANDGKSGRIAGLMPLPLQRPAGLVCLNS